MTLKLSILDLSPLYDSETAAQAFQHTIELARKADAWGYHRFWVSEHHGSDRVVGSSPEVLVSHLLAKTETHPGGIGRRHVAALQPLQGRREFQRTGVAGTGSGGPGHRSRTGWHAAVHARPAAGQRRRKPLAVGQIGRAGPVAERPGGCESPPCTVCALLRSRPSLPSSFCSAPRRPAPNWPRTWPFHTCSPTS